MITKKITIEEVITALQNVFNIKKIKFMRTNGSEKDSETFDMFDYIEGEEQ
jgi:hypothetical protein